MKKILVFIMVFALLSLTACDVSATTSTGSVGGQSSTPATSQGTSSGSGEVEDPAENILKDIYFRNGFKVSKASSGFHTATLETFNEGATPAWTFAQWGTRHDIMDGDVSSGFGQYVFTSGGSPAAKILIVDVNTGMIDMTLNAESEYDYDRLDGEEWPHTLLEQSWFGSELTRVADAEELRLSMKFKVKKIEDKSYGTPSQDRHCAQFVWYVTLQNRNLDSPDYGKYIWFGLNLFDNRMAGKVTSTYAQEDGGKESNTGAFIYQPSSSVWSSNGKMTTLGTETVIDFDILETARVAYDTAIERNYLGSTKFEDLYIGSTNFGFEVTGTYNASVQISEVGIYCRPSNTLAPQNIQ